MKSRFEHSLSVALLLLISLLSRIHANAALSVTIGQGTAGVFTAGSVPVVFTTDTPTVALQFDVQFDPGVLISGPVIPGPSLTNQSIVFSQPKNGMLRIVIYSRNNSPIPVGLLLSLQFTGNASGGSSFVLTPVNAIAANLSAQQLSPVNLIPGSFSISSGVSARFTSIGLLNGVSQLELTAEPGLIFALQGSPNLIDWVSLSTNTIPPGGLLRVNDSAAPSFKTRFYRAVQR